jgi:hypothetical protein
MMAVPSILQQLAMTYKWKPGGLRKQEVEANAAVRSSSRIASFADELWCSLLLEPSLLQWARHQRPKNKGGGNDDQPLASIR